ERSQRRRDLDDEGRGLGVVLPHVAVRALDPALRVSAEEAHVALAGLAIGAVVGTADRRDDEVASGESRYPLPHRLDHAQRLVTDDQEGGTRRRLAVEAAVDLRVGTIDADLEDAHQRRIPGRRRNRELDLPSA